MENTKKTFIERIIGFSDNYNDIENSRIKSEETQSSIGFGEASIQNDDKSDMENTKIYLNSNENKNKKGFLENRENIDNDEGQLSVDVYQTEDYIIITSIVGEVAQEDIDISIDNDVVAIKGTRKNPNDAVSGECICQECFWGNFFRSIILPCEVKIDEIEAIISNGVLKIKLPIEKKKSSVKIKVKVK